jgi:RNA polymerase sigma-70 factor (ECF subfamily)
VNEGLNWKRRWKRRLRWRHHSFEEAFQQDSQEPESAEEGPEDRYLKKEFSLKIQDVLLKLPEDARTVFVLKEMEELSYEEIAAALNIKRGTVSSRLFYARKRLKDLLEEVADET